MLAAVWLIYLAIYIFWIVRKRPYRRIKVYTLPKCETEIRVRCW